MKITIYFPLKQPANITGYRSAPGGVFPFTFDIDGTLTSKESALIASEFLRDDFHRQMREQGYAPRRLAVERLPNSQGQWLSSYTEPSHYPVEIDGIRL